MAALMIAQWNSQSVLLSYNLCGGNPYYLFPPPYHRYQPVIPALDDGRQQVSVLTVIHDVLHVAFFNSSWILGNAQVFQEVGDGQDRSVAHALQG